MDTSHWLNDSSRFVNCHISLVWHSASVWWAAPQIQSPGKRGQETRTLCSSGCLLEGVAPPNHQTPVVEVDKSGRTTKLPICFGGPWNCSCLSLILTQVHDATESTLTTPKETLGFRRDCKGNVNDLLHRKHSLHHRTVAIPYICKVKPCMEADYRVLSSNKYVYLSPQTCLHFLRLC